MRCESRAGVATWTRYARIVVPAGADFDIRQSLEPVKEKLERDQTVDPAMKSVPTCISPAMSALIVCAAPLTGLNLFLIPGSIAG